MLIEDVVPNQQAEKLAALAQFLIGRAEDSASPKKISTQAFVNLANSMGIPVTHQQLISMSQQDPMRSLIVSVEPQEIRFRGSEDEGEASVAGMSVNQAQKTVDTMARRATDNAMKGIG
jgi:hypothetical protein